MRRLVIAIALASLMALSAGLASAQTPDHHPLFDKMDTNHDGFLTKDEIQKKFPKFTDEMFKQADTDHDGKLTVAEWQAFVKARRGAKQGTGM